MSSSCTQSRDPLIGGLRCSYIGAKIYREFQFGDLASLLMLETRLVNRSNGELDPMPEVDADGDGYGSSCTAHVIMPQHLKFDQPKTAMVDVMQSRM